MFFLWSSSVSLIQLHGIDTYRTQPKYAWNIYMFHAYFGFCYNSSSRVIQSY